MAYSFASSARLVWVILHQGTPPFTSSPSTKFDNTSYELLINQMAERPPIIVDLEDGRIHRSLTSGIEEDAADHGITRKSGHADLNMPLDHPGKVSAAGERRQGFSV